VTSNLQDDQNDVVIIAQAQQRLSQEQQVFVRRMERDKALFRLQLCCGWVVLVLLPVVAVVSVVIMINYRAVPASMLTAACAAFFVDVLGLLVAAYKTLLPQKPGEERVSPVTAMPASRTNKKPAE
jgi:hypothetical protein